MFPSGHQDAELVEIPSISPRGSESLAYTVVPRTSARVRYQNKQASAQLLCSSLVLSRHERSGSRNSCEAEKAHLLRATRTSSRLPQGHLWCLALIMANTPDFLRRAGLNGVWSGERKTTLLARALARVPWIAPQGEAHLGCVCKLERCSRSREQRVTPWRSSIGVYPLFEVKTCLSGLRLGLQSYSSLISGKKTLPQCAVDQGRNLPWKAQKEICLGDSSPSTMTSRLDQTVCKTLAFSRKSAENFCLEHPLRAQSPRFSTLCDGSILADGLGSAGRCLHGCCKTNLTSGMESVCCTNKVHGFTLDAQVFGICCDNPLLPSIRVNRFRSRQQLLPLVKALLLSFLLDNRRRLKLEIFRPRDRVMC